MTEILISEVGLRDGLQSIERVMPIEAKKRWIAAEAAAGVREIEVGSFVPPKLLPQLADTAELVEFALGIDGLTVVALVPNAKGAANAAAAGVHGMTIPFSMSETHSIKNVRKDHPAMLAEIAAVAGIAREHGIHFAVSLSTAFGCTMEGAVAEDQVVRLAEAAADRSIPVDDAAGMQPWYLALILSLPACAARDLATNQKALDSLLIDRAAFYLNDYSSAFALVLTSMLIFSGLGSMIAGKVGGMPKAASAIGLIVVLAWIAAMLIGGEDYLMRTLDQPLWMSSE